MSAANAKTFFIPEKLGQEQLQHVGSFRGQLLLASCHSGDSLARRVLERYRDLSATEGSSTGIRYLDNVDFRFSDGETCARLDIHVGGYDVFVFQALYDPLSDRSVDENYVSLLISARAFREHGAAHVTAVLPYLAYARQDKPTRLMREPTTAKLMADLGIAAGIDRLLTWHAHSPQTRGFYGNVPVDLMDPLALFADEFRQYRGRQDVIVVAPDAGASKLVTHLAQVLDLQSAIASKVRPDPEKAAISEVIGDLRGKRTAIVLDDMISSGGTAYALIRKLVTDQGIEHVYLGVSHNLCLDLANARLRELHASYGLEKVIVTNSIPQTDAFRALPFLEIRDLSDTLARAINRIHYDRSVSELFHLDD